MEIRQINLYEYYGQPREDYATGNLTCWLPYVTAGMRQSRRRPAILVIPGGGYRFVSDREGEPIAMRFLVRGYAAFMLEYSVAPAKFPTALREAAMAMRYIREHAEEFAVDPQMVAAVGFSAGGHLCGTLGTMYDCPEVADIAAAEVIRPNALGLSYPVTVSRGKTHNGSFENISGGDEALRDRLSMDKLVRPDMPPVFLWHTRTDATVPCRGSLLLAAALEDADVDFALHMYRFGKHGLSTANDQTYKVQEVPPISKDVPGWLDAMMEFFADCGLKNQD